MQHLKILLILNLLYWAAGVPQWFEGTDGNKYLVEIDNEYNWFEAWNYCASQELQLAVIDSNEKNLIISKILTKLTANPLSLWLAGHDQLNPGTTSRQFYWYPTGEKFSFSNWQRNEPNNLVGNENCVHIYSENSIYEWNDKYCSIKYGFICERNHLLTKCKNILNGKRSRIDQELKKLSEIYAEQQRLIRIANRKSNLEIEQVTTEMKMAIEELQTSTRRRVKEINDKHKETIDGLVDKFTEKLENNQNQIDNILQ